MKNEKNTTGVEIIRAFVRTLPGSPGVYRMLGADGASLYIGKARSLNKRVAAYTRPEKLPLRLQQMITKTARMDFTATHTEAEALLLEAALIKKHRPRYNILLRDDKSFPYILITGDHDFPQVTKHRGAQKKKGDYFGPFASGQAVNRTIALLHRAFQLRNCSDSVFKSRSRPCLQYQIKRCTAPCVGYVSKKDYAAQVKMALDFLTGKSRKIQDTFTREMQKASVAQDYERAADFRDRIRALTTIQAQQTVHIKGLDSADVHVLHRKGAESCVQVLFFRGGQPYGSHAFFPRHEKEVESAEVLAAFVTQFYATRPAPKEIILNLSVADKALMEAALETKISVPQRGSKKALILQAEKNARVLLAQKAATDVAQAELFEKVADVFNLEEVPARIEVFDNSHLSGTQMLGAMIVATPQGFAKNAYRKFNAKGAEKTGDDFAMMREMMTRRFAKGKTEEGWPDLLLIDGGKGQLSAVLEVLADLGISDLPVVAMAKGKDRNAGRETFFQEGKKPLTLPADSDVLYFLQRLRDEAHRFAITAQRGRRKKALAASPLDEIPGIGAKRKKALLLHFGSVKDIASAGLSDLQRVSGISQAVAEKIYNHFHES